MSIESKGDNWRPPLRVWSNVNQPLRQLGLHRIIEQQGPPDAYEQLSRDRGILANRHLFTNEEYEAACDRLSLLGIPTPRILRDADDGRGTA